MEEGLNVYCLPYNPEKPVICMDEQPIQLITKLNGCAIHRQQPSPCPTNQPDSRRFQDTNTKRNPFKRIVKF